MSFGLVALVLCAAAPSVSWSAGDERASLPSLSGTHVRHHRPSGTELSRAAVELSPRGLRVRGSGTEDALEMIQDFVGDRAWFVDRERAIFHRLPMSGSRGEAYPNPGVESSFLGSEPCGPAPSRDEGSGRWRGRAVGVHTCLDGEGDPVAVELLDAEHGIVVYRHGLDGYVDELQDLREREFGPARFLPPRRYRPVDGQEFFHGAPALGEFDESRTR